MSWRERSIEVIDAVKRANPGADRETLRRLVSEAYPFGERRFHPYKVWLGVVRELLGMTDEQRARRDQAVEAPLFKEPNP